MQLPVRDEPRISTTFLTALTGIVGCAIAFAFQLNRMPATFFRGEYLPADNDAFYHARRILDAVSGSGNVAQFDPTVHAPHGMLIPWPWGFDTALAWIVRLLMAAGLTDDPVKTLVYVPPFAVIVSILLLLAVGKACGLGRCTLALLVAAVAVSPLTQAIHGIGSVDHHFAEYIMLLAFLAAGLAWLNEPSRGTLAALTGAVLGIAPAMHTLLFVLQVPLLAALAMLWFRGKFPLNSRTAGAFAAALAIGTILAVAPSLPLRLGYSEHYYLAWFHVYVACCTILTVAFLTRFNATRRTFAMLAMLTILLALPLLSDVRHAAGFLSDETNVLGSIGEVKSVWQMFQESPARAFALYSWLVALAPILTVAYALLAWRAERAALVLVGVVGTLFLPLMLTQFRFHYYGSVMLFLLPLLVVDWTLAKRHAGRIWGVAAMLLVLAYGGAMIPSVRAAIASESIPGRDPYFALTRLAMPALKEACATDPGVVLAKNNDGHYISYYTDCSVIANNFFIAPDDFRLAYTLADLFNQSPSEIKTSKIPIKYVLVRARGAVVMRSDGLGYGVADEEDAKRISDRLTDALLWTDSSTVDPGFNLVAEITAPGKNYPYARIWKLAR